MPPTPSQIKELLLSAIDKDENIVDMGSVTKAVSLLESNPITKDALEETRLGRLVQIVRKKATTGNLKKRCTALIKQWQSQFLPPSAVKPQRTESPVPNQEEVRAQEGSSTSDGQKLKPAKQTVNATSVDKSKSENLRRRKRQPENSPSISPSSQAPPHKKLISSQGQSPSLQDDGNGQDDSSVNGMSSKRDTDRGRKIKDPVRTDSPQSSVPSPKARPSINKDKSAVKKLKSDKSASPKPGKKDSSVNSVSPRPLLKAEKPAKPDGKCSPRLAKVKSDKRVKVSPGPPCIAIGKKRSSSLDRSPRPSNDSSTSHSPAITSGPSQKSTGLFSTDWDIASFTLPESGGESSRSATPQNVYNTPGSSKPSSIFDLDFADPGSSQLTKNMFDRPASPAHFIDEQSFTPTISAFSDVSQRTEFDHYAQKEEEDVDDGEEEEEEEEEEIEVNMTETLEDELLTPPCPVLEGDIDRIHNEQWEGVNGCYNDRREWFDWMQCLTVNTDEENSIQILPYVCID